MKSTLIYLNASESCVDTSTDVFISSLLGDAESCVENNSNVSHVFKDGRALILFNAVSDGCVDVLYNNRFTLECFAVVRVWING